MVKSIIKVRKLKNTIKIAWFFTFFTFFKLFFLFFKEITFKQQKFIAKSNFLIFFYFSNQNINIIFIFLQKFDRK